MHHASSPASSVQVHSMVPLKLLLAVSGLTLARATLLSTLAMPVRATLAPPLQARSG
jgi:hypothetical protein